MSKRILQRPILAVALPALLLVLSAKVPAAPDRQSDMQVITVTAEHNVPAVREVMPEYPGWLKKRGIEGAVVLSYSLDRRGNPERVRVEDASHRGFVSEATRALVESKFETTRRNGRPVRVNGQVRRYVFELDPVGGDLMVAR